MQFMQLSIKKPEIVGTSTGFELVIRRQLNYEATDVGSWSFMGCQEPVRNECKVICEIFQILQCGCEMREAMIFAVMNAICASAYIEA